MSTKQFRYDWKRYSRFPDPLDTDVTGLVAVSDEMTAELLLDAYAHGIFPWTDDPVGWFCPDPRAVFEFDSIRLPSNLPKLSRKRGFHVTRDTAFHEVIEGCARAHGERSRWISDAFVDAYGELHELGYAHSVEVWAEGELVGGLYGVQVGAVFSGESMFHDVPDASKVAFAALADWLPRAGVTLFDAQVINEFTRSLGAREVPRRAYMARLRRAVFERTPFDARTWPAQTEHA